MKPSVHTLANGLTVIFVKANEFPTLTSLLLVGAGSRYENEKDNGIAHFLEHMFFKGSKKYPNSFVVTSAIEGIGGLWNAFTAKDYTGYWVKATNDHFDKVIDVISDVLLNPLFLSEEIEKEKGVIVEEINMYEDTPARRVGEIFENLLYKGNALGYDIAGTKKTVTSFKRNDFISYMQKLYYPNNSVLIIAGGFVNKENPIGEYDQYLKIIENKFKQWNRGKSIGFHKVVENQKKPQLVVKYKKSEQAHFCLGFRTFSYFDQRKYALSILATILGGGGSSRLFMELRELRGLCYYISTGREHYHDVGMIVTQAGVPIDKDKTKEAISVTLKEHNKIKKGNINEEEIKRAKELIKGRLLISMEDSQNVASFYGMRRLLQERMESPQEVIEMIEKITVDKVTDLATEIFKPENLNIALIGPFKDSDIKLEDFPSL